MAKDLTDALHQLMQQHDANVVQAPKALQQRGEAPAQKSAALNTNKPGGSGGAAGPFTETAYADRQFWASRMKTTPDGIFTFALSPIKKIKMTDANGGDASLFFKDIP